jgi:GWxTD domain-containing protein
VITMFLSVFWVQRLGWTLLHFLWQGTAIALVYATLRRLLARSLSAKGRYTLACAALAAMAIAPPLTFLLIPNVPGSSTPIASAQVAFWTVSGSESQRLMNSVVALWLAGVLVFSLRLFGGWRFTARLRSASYPAPPEWQQTVEQIAARLGGGLRGAARSGAVRRVRLLVSSLVDVPTVIGWLKPVILVPVELLAGLPAGQVTALLAHEMAHIRRSDYLASILQSVTEAVLFYHPAVWWISEQIRAERELCCDDLAVVASGDVLTYAQALAALESRQPSRLAPVLAANGGSLVYRIRRLIEPSPSIENALPGPGAAWAMTLLWLAGVGVATLHAAQTPVLAPRVVNLDVRNPSIVILNPARVATPSSAVPATLAGPVTTLGRHARNTLLYDPFLSAQLAQPQGRGGAEGGTVREKPQSPWREWLNDDVAYIITDQERSAFVQLNSDEERARFVEQFWLRRDPTPDTIENEYKEEHYRRIAYANDHFASGMPGRKTDRGRIYITLGPPDEIDSHPSGGGDLVTAPFEAWLYRYVDGIGSNVKFEFFDGTRTGEYRLAMYQLGRDRLGSFVDMRWPLQAGSPDQVPDVKFKDLEAAVGAKTTDKLLPMQVHTDYVRVSGFSTMALITVQFENRDLQFQSNDGAAKSTVNLFGRVSTMTRRPVLTFEQPMEINVPPGQLEKYVRQGSIYQHSVVLSPGLYRLDMVAKDTVAGNLNNYEVLLDVPSFDEDDLESSSLLLADVIQRLPAKSFPGGAVFGDTNVRPRLGGTFTSEEKLGIYLQVYNFRPDNNTQRPFGSIEYEIDKAGSNDKVMDFSEDVGKIPNSSASQVTIAKMLPLRTFQPGTYTLRITATDNNGNQTLQRQGSFTVSPE